MYQTPLIPHVSEAWGGLIKVRDPHGILKLRLQELGFEQLKGEGIFQASATTTKAQANIFAALRNLGVAFVHGGREPSTPASLFLELCAKGLLSGSFFSIYWYSPK